MKKDNHLKQLSILTAAALAISATPLANADNTPNPFGMTELSQGYNLAAAEGKCGESKCGGSKNKTSEGKCGESKCGSNKDSKASEAKCGEGKCGASKKAKAAESKCGEAKCGGK